MQLSKRLAAISAMVTKGNRVVDVGCDHGYIPIYLVRERKIPGAIAMDIRKDPLLRARENIRRYGLSDYIETRQSDGLSSLHAGEGDSLVIAGMGGPLMERILSEGAEVLGSFQELILEPQSEVGNFRTFLTVHGYGIAAENMVVENGKYYPVIKAVYKETKILRPEQLEYGPCLLRDQNPVLHEYLVREGRNTRQLISKLEKGQTRTAKKRKSELQYKLKVIDLAYACYDLSVTD